MDSPVRSELSKRPRGSDSTVHGLRKRARMEDGSPVRGKGSPLRPSAPSSKVTPSPTRALRRRLASVDASETSSRLRLVAKSVNESRLALLHGMDNKSGYQVRVSNADDASPASIFGDHLTRKVAAEQPDDDDEEGEEDMCEAATPSVDVVAALADDRIAKRAALSGKHVVVHGTAYRRPLDKVIYRLEQHGARIDNKLSDRTHYLMHDRKPVEKARRASAAKHDVAIVDEEWLDTLHAAVVAAVDPDVDPEDY